MPDPLLFPNASGPAQLRAATLDDVTVLFKLIQALAAYEQLSHEVTGTAEALAAHLFGPQPKAEAIIARLDDRPVGFALYFYTFSTFLMKPGLYLEDLFILPPYRRQGIGSQIFQYLAQRALAQGCGRFEWSVLDWNEPALAFYEKKGAVIMADWRVCRVTGDTLTQLATGQR